VRELFMVTGLRSMQQSGRQLHTANVNKIWLHKVCTRVRHV